MKNTIARTPFMRIAMVMTVLCLVFSCGVYGTLALYTSATSGSDAAVVAEWSFEVNDAQFATNEAQTLTFDLFKTINEADTTTAEADVTAGKKIAPGTGGSFALKIENLSEVNATYTLALTETNASNVPVQFSLDGNTWYDDLAAINTAQTDVAIAKETGTTTVTVYWRWCIDGTSGAHAGQNNAADTALGILAQGTAPSVTIGATLTATQVN